MNKIKQLLAIGALCFAPMAMASSNFDVIIDAPNSQTPLYINNIVTNGLNVVSQVCNGVTCTFTLTGSTFWHHTGTPDTAVITVANNQNVKDKEGQNSCTFTFDDNGTLFWFFFHYKIRLANSTCTGGFTSTGLQSNHITVYGQ